MAHIHVMCMSVHSWISFVTGLDPWLWVMHWVHQMLLFGYMPPILSRVHHFVTTPVMYDDSSRSAWQDEETFAKLPKQTIGCGADVEVVVAIMLLRKQLANGALPSLTSLGQIYVVVLKPGM